MKQLRLAALVVILLIAVLGSSCGGDGAPVASIAQETVEPLPSPTATPGDPLPSGWRRFSEDAFSGVIQDGWIVTYLDTKRAAQLTADSGVMDMAPSTLDPVAAANASEPMWFAVYVLSANSTPSALMVIPFPCRRPQDVPADGAVGIAQHQITSIEATIVGNISSMGFQRDIFKLKLSSTIDTFQTVIQAGDCFLPAFLYAPPGNAQAIDDFKAFLSYLKVDPNKHRP